ncbi:putative RNA helicase [Trypanosoma grayi]|uniref:putative RNA helicase n=1 Tax=Trypanosoma grayi TaxID=71804 RepID=UPI0004F43D69|nr:putative RNA helicase [Trypanosoma grayi]KEG12331.1 putative RNA helicase [Trypanosoma grayi]
MTPSLAGKDPTTSVVSLPRQQQQEFVARHHRGRGAHYKPHTFTLDVPVTQADVARWETHFNASAPPPPASNAAFNGGGFLDATTVLAMKDETERLQAVHKLAPMKPFDPQRVARTPMTKVLTHRRKWLPYRQRLPVYQCRGPLLDALLNKQVLALVAPPASGRTLQLPQIISETEVFKNKRVIVVCPTSLAACRVAERLREERGEDAASTTVAVCTSIQYDVSEGTLIAVTTPEMLLHQLICDPLLLRVDCVILNDINLRTPTTELCMSFLRNILQLLTEEGAVEKRGGVLRVVVDCLEDALATTISDFFGEEKTARVNLQQVMHQDLKTTATEANYLHNLWSPPCILHLEETIQWLAKCDEEGSSLCRDPVEDLRPYVENMSVVAKIMAAKDADFTVDSKIKSYWSPIIIQAVKEYDRAERKDSSVVADEESQQRQRPSVMVIVPNVQVAELVADAFHCSNKDSTISEEESKKAQSPLSVHVLRDHDTLVELNSLFKDNETARNGERLVLLATPMMAQTGLPPTLDVGLVVDCARQSYSSYDVNSYVDTTVMEYSTVQELRYRCRIARVRCLDVGGKNDAARAPACTVIQLIPKSDLHSIQHRRISSDPGHHNIFHMSWDGYVKLYHILQAREEGVRHRRSTSTSSAAESTHLLSSMVAQLIPSHFVGVSAASSSRYEQLSRTFAVVEHHLQRLGHLEKSNGDEYLRLSPLGMASACLPWHHVVVRLLLLSLMSDCLVLASLVAAMWMVGSLFSSGEADAETRQLMNEARVFFSGGSGSDIMSAFYAYRMWLSLRGSSEEEEAFLANSHISKKVLLHIEQQQLALIRVLDATAISGPSTVKNHSRSNGNAGLTSTDAADVASAILEIPENALLEGHTFLRCITAAIYPQCAVPHDDGTVSLLEFKNNLAKAVTGGGGSGAAPRLTVVPAMFSEESVMNSEEVWQQYSEKPYLYLYRSRIAEKNLSVLEEATPLCMDAAVVFCGEMLEWSKQPSYRCRGWTSIMTNAWRQTKLSRRLPPPAQLPSVSIALKPYDTIQVAPVVVQVDGIFLFSMRTTTASWLQQMREQVRRRLKALLCDKSWPVNDDAMFIIREAWDWWAKRERDAHGWLREERAIRFSATTAAETQKNAECALCPYYQYSANPGKPTAVEPSRRQPNTHAVSSLSAGDVPATASVLDGGVKQPMAYVGKMPDPVMDRNILQIAQSVATARTRKQEARFLNLYPDLFAFLHPEHELHGYYLHVLRREAPDLEVLGDNLEELENFLKDVEKELQSEIGISSVNPVVSTETQPHGTDSTIGVVSGDGRYQFQEVNAEEYMSSYGMQVETAAEHKVRPPTLFKTHDTRLPTSSTRDAAGGPPPASSFFAQQGASDPPNIAVAAPTPAESSAPLRPPPVDSNASIGSFTFEKGAQSTGPSFNSGHAGGSGSGGAPTLFERLLAIKEDGAAPPPTQQPAVMMSGANMQDTIAQQSSQVASTMGQGVWATTNATPSAQPLTFNPNTSPESVLGAPSQQIPTPGVTASIPPPSTPPAAELLALMGILPPAPAVNPLTKPPPPLPAEAIANRPPSVLVYPVPPREYGNIPLILAKALGETMGVKVGPTRIVGNVARIDVRNHKVEARALALKSFTCVGKKVHIFKNERIIDHLPHSGNREETGRPRSRDDVPRHLQRVDYSPENQGEKEEGEDARSLPYNAQKAPGYAQNQRQPLQDVVSSMQPPKKSSHAPQIGLLTDSEDDDDDDDEELSSSADSC